MLAKTYWQPSLGKIRAVVSRFLSVPREQLRFAILAIERMLWPHIYDATLIKAPNAETGNQHPRILVHLHLHYPELWDELAQHLELLSDNCTIHITVTSNVDSLTLEQISQRFTHAVIHTVENRGRDVLPFLYIIQNVALENFDAVLKIHGKKSPHRSDGDRWRQELIATLMPSASGVEKLAQHIKSSTNISLATSSSCIYSEQWWGANRKEATYIANSISQLHLPRRFVFAAGTMFWAKPTALLWIQTLDLSSFDFTERPQIFDGTAAHAFERLFGLIPRTQDLEVVAIEKL